MTVERVAVGGSAEGATSAYVLPERGVVVDPGPPGAWADLRAGVERAGLAVADVEHVLVTHWHVDHAGLAPELAERADATLGLHEADAPLVADYAAERERRLDRDAATMVRWGVPESVVERVVGGDDPSPMPPTYPVDALRDGDSTGGVTVVHAPGHTEGHAAFRAGGVLFVGDAVLPDTTPNVGGSDTRLTDPLATYLDTLERLGGFDGRVDPGDGDDSGDGDDPGAVAPGHGASVDLDERLPVLRSHHRERARRTLAALADPDVGSGDLDDGPADGYDAGRHPDAGDDTATPWTVARRLFGELRGVHVKFGAGEAAAHLARLSALGAVREVADDPLRYRPTGRGFERRTSVRNARGPKRSPRNRSRHKR